jgi:hypothetical protein
MERFKLKIGIYGDEDVRAAVWRTTPGDLHKKIVKHSI